MSKRASLQDIVGDLKEIGKMIAKLHRTVLSLRSSGQKDVDEEAISKIKEKLSAKYKA